MATRPAARKRRSRAGVSFTIYSKERTLLTVEVLDDFESTSDRRT